MGDKSMAGVSFGDTISHDTSYTSATGSARTAAKRNRETWKLKRQMENMGLRKLLFRPKVYDYWRDGDEDNDYGGNDKLLRDVIEKEHRLLAKKRAQMEAEEEEEDEENVLVGQLDKLKSRKQREEEFKKKIEDERRKREEEETLDLEEKIKSEQQNPTIYGWYFTDGYYDNAPYFGVRQDLVKQFQDEQQQWMENWAKKYPESFTDKFRRIFWPPHYVFNKKFFRTRGSYLDFPETIADKPKVADVNFEREPREYITNRHELFGVMDEETMEQEELERAQRMAEQMAEEMEEMIRLQQEEEERGKGKKRGRGRGRGRGMPPPGMDDIVMRYHWYKSNKIDSEISSRSRYGEYKPLVHKKPWVHKF